MQLQVAKYDNGCTCPRNCQPATTANRCAPSPLGK
ncbi:unnamed protein product, partial [Heterosigma akashiwo]